MRIDVTRFRAKQGSHVLVSASGHHTHVEIWKTSDSLTEAESLDPKHEFSLVAMVFMAIKLNGDWTNVLTIIVNSACIDGCKMAGAVYYAP